MNSNRFRLIRELFKRILPRSTITYLQIRENKRRLDKIKSYGLLDEKHFTHIIKESLNIQSGDNIFVHSSLDSLQISFPPQRLIAILKEQVGKEGTIVMPSFSGISHDFLKNKVEFNVRRTPSQSGIISEIFRRNPDSIRSLHPTKSVVACGPLAEAITNEHHKDKYPFGQKSPFYKMIKNDFVVVGLGVTTSILSLVHCVEDMMKDEFPVRVMHNSLFESKCINTNGEEVQVPTFAHNMFKINHNIPKYINKNFGNNIDRVFFGRNFYKISSESLYTNMRNNANNGKTIYPFYSYKFKRLLG